MTSVTSVKSITVVGIEPTFSADAAAAAAVVAATAVVAADVVDSV